MQALYGFFQSDTKDLAKGEKDLFTGIEKIYDLFVYQLAFLIELKHVAGVMMEEAKIKRLPTQDDLNPNLKFIENKFINHLEENIHVKREMNNRKISWNNEFELVKKVIPFPNPPLIVMVLPAVEIGSSIMPGKVNPSIPEMLNMVLLYIPVSSSILLT